jgi:hypothetical protein
MQASHVRLTYVVSDPWTELSRGWSWWLQCGGKIRRATSLCLHYLAWEHANRGCLTTEILAPLSKAWLVLWSVLHIQQNDTPPSTRMDGPRVKCIEFTMCSMTMLVRCVLRQSVVPCCSTVPKCKNESENPSPRSLFTFQVFALLSHLVAMRQGVCCFYLTSSWKYALFSFSKWREKDQTG